MVFYLIVPFQVGYAGLVFDLVKNIGTISAGLAFVPLSMLIFKKNKDELYIQVFNE